MKKSSPNRLDPDTRLRSGDAPRPRAMAATPDGSLSAQASNPQASAQRPVVYEFGSFRLEPRESRLLKQGVPVALSPKALETLVVLVAHAGHLVDKGELLRQVWADTIVEEGSLAQHVYLVRKALSDEGGEARYVETVPRRGYRFTAAVRVIAADDGLTSDRNTADAEPAPVRGRAPDPLPGDAIAALDVASVGRPAAPPDHAQAVSPSGAYGRRRTRWLRIGVGLGALSAVATIGVSVWLRPGRSADVADRRAVGVPMAVVVPPAPKAQGSTPPAEAQAAYLRGREHWSRRTEAGLGHALRYFEQALRLDPRHAPALAGLADTYGVAGALRYGPLSAEQAFQRAEAYALQALALDANLAEAHTALALVRQYHDRDAQAAKSEYRRALQLDPESAVALQRYGALLLDDGQVDAATEALERAARLDPVSPSLQFNLCYVLYLARQERRALPYCDRALEVEPDLVQALNVRGLILMQEARWHQAIQVLQRARRLARGTALAETLEALGQAYTAIGRPDQAQALLSELRHAQGGGDEERVNLAGLHLALGQVDEAWALLRFDSAKVPSSLRFDPRYEALRRDERFRRLAPGDPGLALAVASPGQPAVMGGGDVGVRTVAPEGPVALER